MRINLKHNVSTESSPSVVWLSQPQAVSKMRAIFEKKPSQVFIYPYQVGKHCKNLSWV